MTPPHLEPHDAIVQLRDQLRARLALLGIDARIVTTEGTRRFIVISPLPLADARTLVQALDASDETRMRPR
jgi:cell division protein FtsN